MIFYRLSQVEKDSRENHAISVSNREELKILTNKSSYGDSNISSQLKAMQEFKESISSMHSSLESKVSFIKYSMKHDIRSSLHIFYSTFNFDMIRAINL